MSMLQMYLCAEGSGGDGVFTEDPPNLDLLEIRQSIRRSPNGGLRPSHVVYALYHIFGEMISGRFSQRTWSISTGEPRRHLGLIDLRLKPPTNGG